MTESTWPTAALDPVRRLHALAARVRWAPITERVLPAPFDQVWPLLADLPGTFGEIQPDMRNVTVRSVIDGQVDALARSRFGMRARLLGRLEPGWCVLQSRFLLVAMAATPETGGSTRVALTGGVRIPLASALVPIGVRREATESLNRLQQLVSALS